MAMTYDSTNKKRLAELQPHVEKAALKALAEAEKAGLDILVTQGLRTYAEQDALYAQGRTKPGKIVTNARGGYSYHNFGLAFDFCLIEKGKAVWEVNSKWKKFVSICKKYGFAWGGDWTSFKDYPHFEMTGGLSLAQCRAKWPGGWKAGESNGGGNTYVADDTLPLKLYSKDGAKKLVSQIQKKLGIEADGYYGPKTVEAVKEFQRKHGLEADGIVGEKTWAKVFPSSGNGSSSGSKYKADDTLPLKLYSKDGSKKLVSKVQKKLGIKADGYYGPQTVEAVKAFQKKNGLAVDGIVGEKTWAKLFPPNGNGAKYKVDDTLPLKLYSKDGAKKLVSKVQKKLGITADGYYGPKTVEAVKAFQRKHGLIVDGIVGEKTWEKLFPPSGGKYYADDVLPLKLYSKDGSKKLVSKVQKALGVKVDGYFGPVTEKAVKEFQKKKGLVVDGIVGKKTWAALF